MNQLILSQIFYKPDQDLVDILADGGMLQLEDMLKGFACSEERNELQEGLGTIKDELNREDYLSKLKTEYNSLFFGPSKILAPPYSSIYIDGFGQVETKTTRDVREIYSNWGVKLRDDIREPADHIAFELSFLHHLDQIIHNKLDNGELDEDKMLKAIEQKKVFLSHMDKWVNKFSKQIINTQQLNFYGLFSRIVVLYVKNEINRI